MDVLKTIEWHRLFFLHSFKMGLCQVCVQFNLYNSDGHTKESVPTHHFTYSTDLPF